MSSGGETPRIGGVPGLAKLSSKAPRAWRNLMRTVTETGPKNLSKSRRARARMLRR